MPPSKEEIVKELSKHFESDDVALHLFAEKLLGMKKEINQNDVFIMKEFMDIYENELYDDDFNNVNDYIHDRIAEINYNKSHSKKKGGSSTKKKSRTHTKKKSSSSTKKKGGSKHKKKRSSQSKKKKSN
jgi:hypothetical protein